MEHYFQIRCAKCRWSVMTSGIADDLKSQNLTETKKGCVGCPRSFKCQKCGFPAKMTRIKKNNAQ